MAKKRKMLRHPNNYGSIKTLSGNRTKPYQVCVNPKINDKGSYSYDVLCYCESREEAMIALAEYNKSPYDLNNRSITFEELYSAFYEDKYNNSKKVLSEASKRSTCAAYKNCKALHQRKFTELKHIDLQKVVDECTLKHSSLELIVSLFHQMYAFAMREDMIEKDASKFVKINIPDDDEHGVRISDSDIDKLWNNCDKEYVKAILIYIYTGWRLSELIEIPKTNIDLINMTMTGGKKTTAGKNRVVPINSKIQEFVKHFYNQQGDYLFTSGIEPFSIFIFRKHFDTHIAECGIEYNYTPHDCRHTFESKLDDAGTPQVIKDRLMGHASKTLGEKIYTHKTIEQLREAVEKI